jgi:hypothetical protein
MAGIATPEATAALLVSMDQHEVRQDPILIHNLKEMRKRHISKLHAEISSAIKGGGEEAIATTVGRHNAAKG